MAVFSGIVAIFEAFPIFNDWLKSFVAWYAKNKIAQLKAEDRAAIARALAECDQIPLEQAIGNPHAGDPSGVAGTHIVDSLPGVPVQKRD